MPAVTQVILYDDTAWPERVLAQEVVRLTLHRQAVEGDDREQEAVELFLTTAARQELEGDLKRWLELGRRQAVEGDGRVQRARPLSVRGYSDRRRWKARLRDWSDSLGLVNKENPQFPAWKTTTDKHYYPAALENAFVAHEEGREADAMALVEQFRPRQQKAG